MGNERPTDEQLAQLELEATKWNRISDGALPTVVAAVAELRQRRADPFDLDDSPPRVNVEAVFDAALAFVGAEQVRLHQRNAAETARHRHGSMWRQLCANAWVDGCGCLSRSIEGACDFCRPLFEAEALEAVSRQESRARFDDLQSAVYEHFKAIDIAADEQEAQS